MGSRLSSCSRPQAECISAQVSIVEEGAQGPWAMLGHIRLLRWLSSSPEGLPDPWGRQYHLVVDSGTGTSAVGAALGVQLMGLPWVIHGVMLAGDERWGQHTSAKQ